MPKTTDNRLSNVRIGRAIAAARVLKGLTQTDLAQKCGTHQTVVSQVESGKASTWQILRVWTTLGLGLRDLETAAR